MCFWRHKLYRKAISCGTAVNITQLNSFCNNKTIGFYPSSRLRNPVQERVMVISSRFPTVVHHFAVRNQSRSASIEIRIRARGWAKWCANVSVPWQKYPLIRSVKQVEDKIQSQMTQSQMTLRKQNTYFHTQFDRNRKESTNVRVVKTKII